MKIDENSSGKVCNCSQDSDWFIRQVRTCRMNRFFVEILAMDIGGTGLSFDELVTAVPLIFLSKQSWLVIIFVLTSRWIASQQCHEITFFKQIELQ